MRVQTFDWDDWNIEHIARHGLEPHDVETACRGEIVVLRGREGRHLVYGRTSTGRYLLVVLSHRGSGVARVITARDMTQQERRFYHHRRR